MEFPYSSNIWAARWLAAAWVSEGTVEADAIGMGVKKNVQIWQQMEKSLAANNFGLVTLAIQSHNLKTLLSK